MKLFVYLMAGLCLLSITPTHAQTGLTYAEKLGFPAGKKVVILHVDDAGMSYDSDQGTFTALEKGLSNSVSVMMPCGWVPHFMAYYKKHPTLDAGIHLVLTSEWENYRWQPLTGRDKAPGLYDGQGSFWPSVAQVVEHASADEVEAEIRAQVVRFRAFGLEPTHLDSHMGTLFVPKFLERYLKVGITEKIPVMFPGGHGTLIAQSRPASAGDPQQLRAVGQQLWNAGLPVLDDLYADSYDWELPKGTPATDENLRNLKTQRYMDLLKACRPGLTYIIMHCTAPTPEFAQITSSGPTRKGDLLAMLDPRLKAFVEKEGIVLTTWRDLIERRKKVK